LKEEIKAVQVELEKVIESDEEMKNRYRLFFNRRDRGKDG